MLDTIKNLGGSAMGAWSDMSPLRKAGIIGGGLAILGALWLMCSDDDEEVTETIPAQNVTVVTDTNATVVENAEVEAEVEQVEE